MKKILFLLLIVLAFMCCSRRSTIRREKVEQFNQYWQRLESKDLTADEREFLIDGWLDTHEHQKVKK